MRGPTRGPHGNQSVLLPLTSKQNLVPLAPSARHTLPNAKLTFSLAAALALLPPACHGETSTSVRVSVVTVPSLLLWVSVRLGKCFPVATAPSSKGLHPSNAFDRLTSWKFTLPAPEPPPAATSAGLLAPQHHATTLKASGPTGVEQLRLPSVTVMADWGLVVALPGPCAARP